MPKQKIPKPRYLIYPMKIVHEKKLAPTDKLVYAVVCWFYGQAKKKCFASNEAIAKTIRTTAPTVRRSLRALEKNGYIKRVFDDETKRSRQQIIPLVLHTDTDEVELETAVGLSSLSGDHDWQDDTVLSGGLNRSPRRANSTSQASNEEKGDVVNLSKANSEIGQTSGGQDGPQSRSREININNITDADPSGRENIGQTDGDKTMTIGDLGSDETEGARLNEAIGLFRTILPGDFATKRTAFSRPPTREAVRALLKRKSLEDIKTLIERWAGGQGDTFRPGAGTVYEFCTSKLAKIEAYAAKSGPLHAHKSTSTPEQARVREQQYARRSEEILERQRKAEEAWKQSTV